jgi:hypothetical protein
VRCALPLVSIALSISCTKGPRADGAPPAAASAAADDGLPSAVNAEPLLDGVPAIVVEHEQVLVDGTAVGDVKALLAAGRMQRIDGELAALQAKREAWKAAHPGAPFPGVALLRMPRDTKAFVVKSVFQTAAYAGYPNLSFTVGTGSPGRAARLRADAQVPSLGDAPMDSSSPGDKVLFVRLEPDKPVVLTWKIGAEPLSVTEVPWSEAFERSGENARAPGLAAKLSLEWKQQRQHFDVHDKKLDQAILQVDDAAQLRDIVAVLDALYEPKRPLDDATVPAFNVTLSPLAAAPPPSSSAARPSKGPKVRTGDVKVDGRLPVEVVTRVVRRGAGSAKCYEAGLAKNPNLRGKVAVRFVIGKNGAVTGVTDAGSDLPDPAVKKCLLAGISALSFPEPESGTVTVVYPLELVPE